MLSAGSTPPNSGRRKSLSDRTIQSESFIKLADSMTFAREPMVSVAPRHSGTGTDGDVFVFGNLTTDDDEDKIDDFQRAVRCLKSEYKTFAAEHFDQLVIENGVRAMAEVWPLLEKELKRTAAIAAEMPSDAELIYGFHEPASRKFPFTIVHLYETRNVDAARKLIGLLFQLIPCTNKELSMYWGECLEKLVASCKSSDVRKDIHPKTIELAMGGNSVSSNGKVGACRALQKLSRRFDAESIENHVLPIFTSLAKDQSAEVRAVAASCLSDLIQRTKNKNEILRLINGIKGDVDPRVRAALTSTLLKSVMLVTPSEKDNNKAYLEKVMQTIKELVKDAYWKENVDLLVAYTEYIGSVCEAFSAADVLTEEDVLWHLDAFLQLSKYGAKLGPPENLKNGGDMPTGFANYRAKMEFMKNRPMVDSLLSSKPHRPVEKSSTRKNNKNHAGGDSSEAIGMPNLEKAHECRKNTAKQFYSFMLFADPIVGFRFGLHPLVSDLTRDPHPEVRAAMVEKLLPIMEHLEGEAGLLTGEVVSAMSDDDLDVIQALVPHLSGILKCLVTAKVVSPERLTPKLFQIGGALLDLEERLNQTTYYKVHKTMLEQLSIVPLCLPGDYVFDNFFPAIFHRLQHMRVLPCRMAAANCVIVILRHSSRGAQREEIRNQIKTEFAQGRSVHDRMLFLYMAKKIMEMFSKKYFRDHFFEEVLVLANDPVGNVRRKVMDLMPELDHTADSSMHQQLQDTVRKARKTEVDRDVIAKITEVSSKINQQRDEDVNTPTPVSPKRQGALKKPADPKKPADVKKAGDPKNKPSGKSEWDIDDSKTKSDPADIQKEIEEQLIENMEEKSARKKQGRQSNLKESNSIM